MADSSSPPEAWRALYPFESHYLRLGNGPRLHYVDEGSGHPVVMVHGNPTWSFYYRKLISAVRNAGLRAVAPDHVGCGLSDKPASYEYRLATHIENLEQLIESRLGTERISLVVHDWGGAVGMGYASRHPERVERITVLNTAAFLLPRCPRRIRVCRWPLFGEVALLGLNAFARAATRMATTRPGGLAPDVQAGFLAPYNSWRNRIATLQFVRDIPLSPKHPTWQTVKDIQERLHLLQHKPMLIGWGMRDFCFTPAFLDEWTRRFPDAAVRRYPEAGHYVLEDAADDIIPAIVEHLTADGR